MGMFEQKQEIGDFDRVREAAFFLMEKAQRGSYSGTAILFLL
jgi:hypothetical protein